MLPGSLLGVVIGGLTFRYMNDDMIRILVGAIAILFTLYRWVGVGGFTSVVAHGGSPPAHINLLPQRLDKRVFIGTTVILFALVDIMKLVPYALLGMLDATNLTTAALLAPVAPVGIWLGVTVQKRLPEELFYRVCYALIFLTGCRLVWQGIEGLAG